MTDSGVTDIGVTDIGVTVTNSGVTVTNSGVYQGLYPRVLHIPDFLDKR